MMVNEHLYLQTAVKLNEGETKPHTHRQTTRQRHFISVDASQEERVDTCEISWMPKKKRYTNVFGVKRVSNNNVAGIICCYFNPTQCERWFGEPEGEEPFCLTTDWSYIVYQVGMV